ELLPRALVAVVEEDVEARGRECLGRMLRDLLPAGQRDDMDVVRCNRARPDDAVLVVALLADRRPRARQADGVTTHDERVLPPVLVEIGRTERLRVEGSELEDVPDLDRGLDLERAAALGARVSLLCLPNVEERRVVVPPGLDAAEMPAVLVR